MPALFGEQAVEIPRTFPGETDGCYALPEGSPAATAGVAVQSIPADINGALYPEGARPCGAYAK